MTRDEQCLLLENNGWKIISKEPFEIEKYENGKLVAKAIGQAAFTIAFHLENDNKLPKEITLKELEKRYQHNLTIGKLKELLAKYDLPDDGKVLIERVRDIYYEQDNWGVVFKKGELWHQFNEHNRKVKNGEFLNKEEYPNAIPEMIKEVSNDVMIKSMEQYHPAWYASRFKDDDKNLYICLHY